MSNALKSFIIVVDRPQPVYRPGEVVTGCCLIDLDGKMNLNQLTIALRGNAKCRWNEPPIIRSGKKGAIVTKSNYEKEICLDLLHSPGAVYPKSLNTGQHKIRFSFQLPPGDLPGSFEGQHGCIRYYIKAHIHKNKAFPFDEKRVVSITIASPLIVSIQEMRQSIQDGSIKTVGLFGAKPVSMKCRLKRMGYNLGTSIPINCFVDNQSKRSMTLRAALCREIYYFAQGKQKKTEENISRLIGNTIEPESQLSEVVSVLVPINAPIVQNMCQIISVGYKVEVTLDIAGSFGLHCQLPVILTNESLSFDHD